ncbi:MAG: ATP-binding cassette domain-containing protein [Ruminiclostridium sp.]|nr:ATP-binding cassette domain-containing protein [Ruminiclostridium sp.]
MNVIEVKNLSKSFGKLKVLENVDLEVKKGEKIVILGGSGCGKSVFLRSLEMLEKPDSGTVSIMGEEITAKGAKIDVIRRKMGMVYQNFNLFSHMTVMENLCAAPCRLLKMPKKEAAEKANELLRTVGLSGKENAMTDTLSGGQKQRIAIARCLMMDPEILLFDEPTSALDPTMVGEVLATIRMLSMRGLTMIIVTHEMDFAKEIADRILFFADHGIYEQGTVEDIFEHPAKEKTIAFIRKLKTIHEHITSSDFDLMRFNGDVKHFCDRYGLTLKQTYNMQLICEELIYEFFGSLNGARPDIELQLEYAEADKQICLSVTSVGEMYDPFEHADNDVHLGVTLIKKRSSSYSYEYRGGQNIVCAYF